MTFTVEVIMNGGIEKERGMEIKGRAAKETGYELMEFLQQQREAKEKELLTVCNERTERFGLVLSETDKQELMLCRNNSLKKHRRVEFGGSILDKIIYAFCDSQYVSQDNYLKILEKLQDMFYEFKNEMQDKMNDEELIHFMREQYEEVCFGDLDYLEGTCLPRMAAAIRGGYRGFEGSDGYGEYRKLSEEERWSEELYYQALSDIMD